MPEGQLPNENVPTAPAEFHADLEASARLLKIGTLFLHDGDPTPVLEEAIDAAIAISRADCGNLQLLDPATGDLMIVAQRGLPAWWIRYWQHTGKDHGAYRTALNQGQRIIVEDVEQSPVFMGTPELDAMRKAGIQAVQSTPLISRTGEPIGILSTHYRKPRWPDQRELQGIDLLARQVTDILERARFERELRDSESRFRALVEASSEVLYAMSPDWSEIRKLSSDGFLDDTRVTTRHWIQSYIPATEQRRVLQAINRAIRNGSVFELEHRVLLADGSEGWVMSRAVPVRGSGGEIIEWFGAACDVSARRRAEEELRESGRRKDEFLAMLGHELRNPLSAIRTSSEVLMRAGTDAIGERAVATIDRQSAHMAKLLDGLLDVTRIARGKLRLDSRIIDVRMLVESVLDDRKQEISRRGLKLATTMPAGPLLIKGDQTRLAQVLDNLVGNAIKFTEHPGSITVALELEGGGVLVRVRDSGMGIQRVMLERMFDAFVQGPQDAARSGGGLGLGLAVSKGLVELHHGKIEARSDGPGCGAEFSVWLPLTEAPAPSEESSPCADTHGLRILVVEDHEAVADSLRLLFELEGHQVWVADTGAAAMCHLHEQRVEFVLCDIGLPGEMNGYDVARAIRHDASLHDIPLVAMTGYGQPTDMKRAAQAGFDEYMTKPVTIEALNRAIERLCDTGT